MSTREVDFAQANGDDDDDAPDIDECGEVRCAPVARRLTDDERFSVALERMPLVVLETFVKIMDGGTPTGDELRVALPYVATLRNALNA